MACRIEFAPGAHLVVEVHADLDVLPDAQRHLAGIVARVVDVSHPIGQIEEPDHDDPQPAPARKVRSRPRPRTTEKKPGPDTTVKPSPDTTGRPPRRRAFTASAKRAGADLGREIGVAHAADRLELDVQTVEAWMRWFPADTTEEQTPPPAQRSETPPTGLTLVPEPTEPAKPLACSCGLTFDDDAGWRAHNDKLLPSQFREHRLSRSAS